MKTPRAQTKDGFELQFGTNHLSHFLLFHQLQDLLIASATPAFHSRVVNVSSSGHRYGPLRLEDPGFAAPPEAYGDGWPPYGASKTANIHMAAHVERRYAARRVHGLALNPGSFASPNLQKHCFDELAGVLATSERLHRYLYSTPQGAVTSVYAAVSAELEGRGGLYLEGASVVGPCPEDGDIFEFGYGSWAFDKEKEEQLWEMSKKMVGVE
jgi:NAD(P)-dependent dehydrogenase (short-subunit alcohol dehydrogenase family)